MVTTVKVTNAEGKATVFDSVNPLSKEIDLGDALSKGTNAIEVKLATSLRNREFIEGAAVHRYTLSSYGLTSAKLMPYSQN
jgi:hypothetical protein